MWEVDLGGCREWEVGYQFPGGGRMVRLGGSVLGEWGW
jgi:hypothetical protein